MDNLSHSRSEIRSVDLSKTNVGKASKTQQKTMSKFKIMMLIFSLATIGPTIYLIPKSQDIRSKEKQIPNQCPISDIVVCDNLFIKHCNIPMITFNCSNDINPAGIDRDIANYFHYNLISTHSDCKYKSTGEFFGILLTAFIAVTFVDIFWQLMFIFSYKFPNEIKRSMMLIRGIFSCPMMCVMMYKWIIIFVIIYIKAYGYKSYDTCYSVKYNEATNSLISDVSDIIYPSIAMNVLEFIVQILSVCK